VVRLALVAAWLAVVITVLGCGPLTGQAAGCLNVAGVVESVAWSPNSRHAAFVANNDTVTVYALDPSTLTLRELSNLDGIDGTQVAINDDGMAYWVSSSADGTASLWSGSATVQGEKVADLPDPLTVDIFWTDAGLQLLRWSGSGLPGEPLGEQWSLVEAIVVNEMVELGPVLEESPDLREVGVAADGVTRALLLQHAAGAPVSVKWADHGGETNVGDYTGISGPSVVDDRVIVRRAEDGKLVAINARDGTITVVRDSETLLGAASADGHLLYAVSKPGGTTDVCVSVIDASKAVASG
jgi:hypothetical protein